ncbi:MAG: beta-ketoacyl-ACP synthase II [Sediminibacterium sp.]|nr:beta-ketoacyl-ACP synthase II [Sediminibacterium sp.]
MTIWKTARLNRVVVTGMGVISPLGNSIEKFWDNIIAGNSGVDLISRFDTTNFKTKFAAEVKGFDGSNYFEKKELKKYDLFTQYALAATQEAVTNASLDFDKLERNRIGVIWGSGNGGIQTFQEQIVEFVNNSGKPVFSPFFIPKIIADIPSGIISIRYGLRGLNFSTISACASSNNAIIDAVNYIRLGKADIIIAGGSEAAINESSVGGFNAARALSTNNNSPRTASRPFDVARDGFVIGEGAGAIIVESLQSAINRNATIYAEITGTGMAADAYHLTGTHPDGEGAFLGMKEALEEADISAEAVDYVNAHATSTLLGDMSELKALDRVFGHKPNLSISSTKSMTGHLLGAAGAVESIVSILSVRQNIVPATINTQTVVKEYADQFDFVLRHSKAREVNIVMNNTFGFGGHIATIIFQKYNP